MNMKSISQVIVLLILSFSVIFLTSCASLHTGIYNPQATTWTLRGKIGVQLNNQPPQMANIYWHQVNNHYNIELYGPLGLGSVYIEGCPEYIKLTDNNGKLYYSRSPEVFLQSFLGYPLPVNNLVYWVRGMSTRHNQGWKVYHKTSHLIILTHSGIQVRIFIDSLT